MTMQKLKKIRTFCTYIIHIGFILLLPNLVVMCAATLGFDYFINLFKEFTHNFYLKNYTLIIGSLFVLSVFSWMVITEYLNQLNNKKVSNNSI